MNQSSMPNHTPKGDNFTGCDIGRYANEMIEALKIWLVIHRKIMMKIERNLMKNLLHTTYILKIRHSFSISCRSDTIEWE